MKQLGFHIGTLASPSGRRQGITVIPPPGIEKVKGKEVKLVVQLNVSLEDMDLVRVLANPLSLVSRKIQMLKAKLQSNDMIPGTPPFFDAVAELQVENSLQQRILTKYALQANADAMALRGGAPSDIPRLPETWLFEQAWERLKWSGISSHTIEGNARLNRAAMAGDITKFLLDPAATALLFNTTVGRSLVKKMKDLADYESRETELHTRALKLLTTFFLREEWSKMESQMVLFTNTSTLFWTPSLLEHSMGADLLEWDSESIRASGPRGWVHIHIMVKGEIMGMDRKPQFVPIIQGIFGFTEDMMTLGEEEKSLLEPPNFKNRFLGLEFFDSNNNLAFYRRSLLLRVLMETEPAETALFWQGARGNLKFKARVALAAQLLKKRGLGLKLSIDTAEGAAQLFQQGGWAREGPLFDGAVPDFSIMIPAPVDTQHVVDYSDYAWAHTQPGIGGDGWFSMESWRRHLVNTVPRLVSLLVYSQRYASIFEAKIPLVMPAQTQNLWAWSEFSMTLDTTTSGLNPVPMVSDEGDEVHLLKRDYIDQYENSCSIYDERMTDIKKHHVERAGRLMSFLDPSVVPRKYNAIPPHPRSFEAIVMQLRFQGSPFLIRDGVAYNFAGETRDYVKVGRRRRPFPAPIGGGEGSGRSVLYQLGNPLAQERGPNSHLPTFFEGSCSVLAGWWNYEKAI